MFDTHCHLNFHIFEKTYQEAIKLAKEAGILYITIPGTDIDTSLKAIEIANIYKHVYAAVGIHPTKDLENFHLDEALRKIEKMAADKKVVAIGETGLDYYQFKAGPVLQKEFFQAHIKLALKLEKSLIIHNRHAAKDILKILKSLFTPSLEGKSVFHCCEPDLEILLFAKKRYVFIGIDGDITYDKGKQAFIKKVPLELLVIETDSPFITPEPLRSQKVFPNEPKNVLLVAEMVAGIKGVTTEKFIDMTTKNALMLYGLR